MPTMPHIGTQSARLPLPQLHCQLIAYKAPRWLKPRESIEALVGAQRSQQALGRSGLIKAHRQGNPHAPDLLDIVRKGQWVGARQVANAGSSGFAKMSRVWPESRTAAFIAEEKQRVT